MASFPIEVGTLGRYAVRGDWRLMPIFKEYAEVLVVLCVIKVRTPSFAFSFPSNGDLIGSGQR